MLGWCSEPARVRLGPEACARGGVVLAAVHPKDLHGDGAAEPGVDGSMHAAHTSGTDRVAELVAAVQQSHHSNHARRTR